MSVFFRWGIFGILGVAALVYVYNASKHIAETRSAREAPAVPATSTEPVADREPAPAPGAPAAAPRCEVELVVARRALEARLQHEPLDRLLRIQEIAFEEPARRQRLTKVATYWFNLGEEPNPEALRAAVVSDCERSTAAP